VLAADELLRQEGIEVDIINARFAKPIDPAIVELLTQDKTLILVEDHSLTCGFGSAVLEAAAKDTKMPDKKAIGRVVLLGGPDEFIPAATRIRQLEWMGLTAEKIVETVKTIIRHTP
jgi:1-deoxy-D-xylulose-5-phosphate synthase